MTTSDLPASAQIIPFPQHPPRAPEKDDFVATFADLTEAWKKWTEANKKAEPPRSS